MLDDHGYFDSTMKNLKFVPFHFLPGSGATVFGFEKKNNEGYYRPLARAVYTVLYVAFGENPIPYHIVNIAYLWAAAFVWYLLIARFLQPAPALASASLFAAHPLNSSMINFIGAGIYLGQTAFMLAALWFALKAWATRSNKPGIWPAVASIACALLAMFCHESAISLPLYAVTLFWALRLPVWRTWPLWVLSAVYFIFRLSCTTLTRNLFDSSSIYFLNVSSYLTGLGKILGWYLSRLFYPEGIVFIWGTVITHSIFWILVFFVLIAGLIAIVWRARIKGETAFLVGVLWLLAAFIPVTLGSITRPDIVCIEPHWMVLGLAGFCLCLGILISRFKYHFVLAVVIVIFFVWMNRQYNDLWANEKRYCHYWIKQFPGFSAPHHYLATAYENDREYDLALQHYAHAFNNSSQRLGNLNYDVAAGVIAVKQGRWKEAEMYLEEAARLDPTWPQVWVHLGVVAFSLGDIEKAERCFAHSIEVDRFQVLGRLNLATVYKNRKEFAKAVELYEQILRMDPRHRVTLIELIELYIKQGDRENILKTARRMEAVGDPSVRPNLDLIYQKYGK